MNGEGEHSCIVDDYVHGRNYMNADEAEAEDG